MKLLTSLPLKKDWKYSNSAYELITPELTLNLP